MRMGEKPMVPSFQSKKHETVDKTKKFSWRGQPRTKYYKDHTLKYTRIITEIPRSRIKIADSEYEAMVLRVLQLETRVAKLEETNSFLTSTLSHMKAEQASSKPFNLKDTEGSTLSMFREIFDMQTFPENPTEKLRGLLSEFNIEENATDIIRDVRDNR